MRFITATSSCYSYSGVDPIQTNAVAPIGEEYTVFNECLQI